jgi:hypothetical protein
MNISLENKIKILEYKLAFEQEIHVRKEFEEGSSDLNYRLSFFRKNLVENNSDQNKVKNFDNIFGQKLCQPDNTNTPNEIQSRKGGQDSFKKNSNVESWLKKTYRQIAKLTHPDMLIGIRSKKILDKLSRYYMIAQIAYDENNAADIIMIASELDIDIEASIIAKEIEPPLEKKIRDVNNTKQKLGWLWYHVPEVNRNAEFKKILNSMGFDFTDKMVKAVIRSKRPRRKIGNRPEKFNVKRRKLT